MEEEGFVIEVKGGLAVVRVIEAGGGCASCASGGTCKAGAEGRVVEAENRAGATPGQRVTLKIESGAFLKASFLVYMVPVIALFLGAGLGGKFGPAVYPGITADVWQALAGVAFLALSILLIRLYDKKVKTSKAFRPVVDRVVEGPACS